MRTQDKESADPNRVGGPNNPLLEGGGLSTMIAKGEGSARLARLHNREWVRRSRLRPRTHSVPYPSNPVPASPGPSSFTWTRPAQRQPKRLSRVRPARLRRCPCVPRALFCSNNPDKALQKAFKELGVLTEKLRFQGGPVKNIACELYKDAMESGKLKGRSMLVR